MTVEKSNSPMRTMEFKPIEELMKIRMKSKGNLMQNLEK